MTRYCALNSPSLGSAQIQQIRRFPAVPSAGTGDTNHLESPGGHPPNECLGDGGLHATELVSLFYVLPTFDATVDAAGDLPGPGAALMAGDGLLE